LDIIEGKIKQEKIAIVVSARGKNG
jgi:hypothetical protein